MSLKNVGKIKDYLKNKIVKKKAKLEGWMGFLRKIFTSIPKDIIKLKALKGSYKIKANTLREKKITGLIKELESIDDKNKDKKKKLINEQGNLNKRKSKIKESIGRLEDTGREDEIVISVGSGSLVQQLKKLNKDAQSKIDDVTFEEYFGRIKSTAAEEDIKQIKNANTTVKSSLILLYKDNKEELKKKEDEYNKLSNKLVDINSKLKKIDKKLEKLDSEKEKVNEELRWLSWPK